MDNFSITTRIETKDYIKVLFIGFYTRPVIIFLTLLGLYFTVTSVLDILNIAEFYSNTPFFELIYGIFILLVPTLSIFFAVRHLKSNPSFQKDITYTFGENGVIVQGATMRGEYMWEYLIKRKEIGKFLILYNSRKLGNFIDKTKLTAEQLEFIRSKVNQKKI